MIKENKDGFTLVELLAVIVILAIILVIAVPKVMSIIEDAKKGTLESTAKMIASAAEKQKVQNTVLNNDKEITCDSVAKINNLDYASCSIEFDNNTAKVTIEGKGKFAGLNVCGGTKTSAVAQEGECIYNPSNFYSDNWATIVTAVKSGNHPYKVGDTKLIDLGEELGVHTLRVANTTPCDGTLASETACGFVLEFADIITEHEMNDTYTTVGGWPASLMRTYINDTIYNSLPKNLKNGIIETRVISGHDSKDTGTRDDGNYESIDKLYLLSTKEVWGKEGSEDTAIIDDTADADEITRQLDYYKNKEVTTDNYGDAIKIYDNAVDYFGSGSLNWYWWLRTPTANYGMFYYVSRDGNDTFSYLSLTVGISPAFRLSD